MKRLFILGMAIAVVFSGHGLAWAQVRIEKFEEYVDMVPGGTVSGSVLVENASSEEITVKAYMEDLEYVAPFNNGDRKAVPLGSTPYSIGKYMTVDPGLFSIAPNGRQEVKYAVTAPPQAKGGYYGVIFFEKVAAAQEGVGLSFRYGCKIYAESSEKTLDVKIEDREETQDGFKGNFLNIGDVILLADVTYTVIDNEGMVFDRGSVCQALSLPPQKKAPFQIMLSGEIPSGNYTMVIDFDRKRAGALVKEIDFTKAEAGVLKIDTIKV